MAAAHHQIVSTVLVIMPESMRSSLRQELRSRRSELRGTDSVTSFDSHHYAFHVSDAEFDVIFQGIKRAGLSYGSAPWSLDDGELNDWNGGRGVYFKDPNGHVLELMTVPQ
jgi:catechol 2,3-dioxygenase-like lactoylglutathione lyase family enzyme